MSAAEPSTTADSVQGSGACGVLSLLTDFGLEDGYVGSLKAVLLSHQPLLRWVDLSHSIAAGDVIGAAWVLHRSWKHFPPGTVHLAVVDPGVGSERRVLVAQDRGHFFLAPDNGLLGPLLSSEARVWCWQAASFPLGPISPTFHGRDVFAPLAAALAAGLAPSAFGPEIQAWQRSEFPTPRAFEGGWQSEVLCCDHFGNLICPLDMDEWLRGAQRIEDWQVEVAGQVLPLVRTYSDVSVGQAAGLIGSASTLEIAVRDGDARTTLAARPGTPICLRRRDP